MAAYIRLSDLREALSEALESLPIFDHVPPDDIDDTADGDDCWDDDLIDEDLESFLEHMAEG